MHVKFRGLYAFTENNGDTLFLRTNVRSTVDERQQQQNLLIT